MRHTSCLAAFAALTAIALYAERLTIVDVVTMVQAKVPQDIIIQKIADCEPDFDLRPGALAALAKAGVTDDVLRAMSARQYGRPVSSSSMPAAAGISPAHISEVGAYIDKKGSWGELLPEIVDFKTGGVLKTVATLAIVKGDVNGHVNGQHSPNAVTSAPIRILVYAPDGDAITEYQLLRLREQSHSREFRTVTGGVLHVSGGATRDVVPFESRKVAPRTYEINLPTLQPGEYGLLPPASGDATGRTGRIGKIYSFRVME
jgi:hypothetical protein